MKNTNHKKKTLVIVGIEGYNKTVDSRIIKKQYKTCFPWCDINKKW